MPVETQDRGGCGGGCQGDQGPRDARADLLRREGDGEHPGADGQGESVERARAGHEGGEPVTHVARPLGQAQDQRRLGQGDVQGDPRQEAGQHRGRQQVGHPAHPEQAGQRDHRADHQGQGRGQGEIVRRPGGRRQAQAAGEDRHDGGVGPRRQPAAGAEHGEAHGGRHEGEETDLRRKAAEPGGGHLFGHGDGGQGEAGDQVGADSAGSLAAQGLEGKPALQAGVRRHGARLGPHGPAFKTQDSARRWAASCRRCSMARN